MLSIIVGLALSATAAAEGQPPKPVATTSKPTSPSPGASKVPRTPDGRPDLQGMWDFAQLTPFERPTDLAGKVTLTEDEAEEFAQRRIETTHKDRRDGGAGRRRRTRLQRLLVGLRHAGVEAVVAGRRSARRQNSGADRRGAASVRRSGRSSMTTRRSARSPSAASSASTPARRWCRAPTTTTCRSCRPATTWSSSTR